MTNDIDVMRKSYCMVDDVEIHITKKVLWRMMCEFTLEKKFYHMADDTGVRVMKKSYYMADDGSYIADIYILLYSGYNVDVCVMKESYYYGA